MARPGMPAPGDVYSVVQPIVRLDDRVIIGYEALARIESETNGSPDWWLNQVDDLGLRTDLEVMFLESAARLGPPPGDALLFVNVSPGALAHPGLLNLRWELPDRLVIEITEQTAVDDYSALKARLEQWSVRHARVAIDDTGAGYSSLRHVIELAPDFLKLDRTLITDIEKDSSRQALVRALVAFSREVGTTVIAEGIETTAEMAALSKAGITLGQGFLFGRPGPAWPDVERQVLPDHPSSDLDRDAGLRSALSRARDATAACDALVAHLFQLGQMMPSLYLEHNGQLRCVAQRGLWQVLDGLPADGGITGRVWATGEAIELADVHSSPDYLEAVPGAVAEICVPVRLDGEVVGALNIDSLSPLPTSTRRQLEDGAALLSRRLSALGWQPVDSPWQRAVYGSVAISGAATDHDAPARILNALLDACGMDSAGLIRIRDGSPKMDSAIGPLTTTLRYMDEPSLRSVCTLVERLSSCYTGSESTGLPYLGSETIRAGGARAVVLLPLRANSVMLGAIVLAHSRPIRLTPDLVEPLELLAGQAAATLNAMDLVEQLRYRAHHDALTGLGNRLALDAVLSDPQPSPHAVLIADLDYFKRVNDVHGHLAGDQALRALADELAVALPDVPFYRLGGDEFICVVPAVDLNRARHLAETVRAVGQRVLASWGTSVSVGGAVVSSVGAKPGDTLALADAALLWTKEHARGEATVTGPDGIAGSWAGSAVRRLG
jgi:diguanylate cyclase (GGDEF)-like protein